jgi:hypothetical protein
MDFHGDDCELANVKDVLQYRRSAFEHAHAMRRNSSSLGGNMRKFKRRQPHALPFRSLLVVTAAAFVLTGFIAPKADAAVVAYFNFQDPPVGTNPDVTPDLVPGVNQVFPPGILGDNPGGGVEAVVTQLTITSPGLVEDTPGLLRNRTSGDIDTTFPGGAVNLSRTIEGPATIAFGVNLQFYAGLSLSFATNNNGNGYGNVQLFWSGAVSGSLPVQDMPLGLGIVNFDLHGTNLDGNGTFKFVTFDMMFTNGHSNGQNLQTVIDNIRLDTDLVVPEPTTIAGGLLGVLGLCWNKRRLLIRCVPMRRA